MVIITVRGYSKIFPHIINIYFLVAAVSECYQMFTPIINICTPHWLFRLGNSCCLVMQLGFIGSPLT